MENSKIEWTDHTFNPWWGCTKISQGCKNCYAETLDNRYNHENPHWGPASRRKFMSHVYWNKPAKWNLDAERLGAPSKVFCASMADVFEDHPDIVYERDRLFAMIEATPWLIWQLLTKRPENVLRFIPITWRECLPDNIWIGTSVENQETANLRIPELIKIPSRRRFLSCEPLLGPVDLQYPVGIWPHGPKTCCWGYRQPTELPLLHYISWVIVGGESGPGSRPMHPEWARSLRDQCQSSQIPFLFKQWGEYFPINMPWKLPEPGRLLASERWLNLEGGHGFHGEDVWRIRKVGKRAAGRLLDDREWNEFPLINKPNIKQHS